MYRYRQRKCKRESACTHEGEGERRERGRTNKAEDRET